MMTMMMMVMVMMVVVTVMMMETVMPTDDENSAKMVKFFEQIGRGKGGFVVQIVFFFLKWRNSLRTSIQNVEPKLVDPKL